MNNYPIFYVVHAEFFENSDPKEKKLKKITKVFENKKPKKLRKKALGFFDEIRDQFLGKNTWINCPRFPYSERRKQEQQKRPYVDTIQDVYFYTKNACYGNIALTVSFGIKGRERTYDYSKNLYPICAVGPSLHEVEDGLKISLILERQLYKNYKIEDAPKEHYVKNFISNELKDSYVLDNLFVEHNYLIQKFLKDNRRHNNNNDNRFFSTFQFYEVKSVKEDNAISEKETFLELSVRLDKNRTLQKTAIYKKELELLSHFNTIISGTKINLLESNAELFRKSNSYFFSNFFTSEQLKIHEEMKGVKEVSKEQKTLERYIKDWL
ncbi:hypothetical protein LPB136_07105 [Tenacibaculum todarodis]|uniref:Uncharacterized protein n=1 Tax=Tenacibaculum todarodis TaxID=1850252 RepID=A0A1L3JJ18_9FLAO|nr:hypothetical protein [Tenacibaculum todarodis]APG65131.1 hypothetical protein LPB136_07105 [Tenacibaculum todarodis]